MSQPRFNYPFFFLMLFGVLSAFIIPHGYTDFLKGKLDVLFVPVSRPVHSLAGMFSHQESPYVADSARNLTLKELQEENTILRNETTNLEAQLSKLMERDAALEKLGKIRDFCKPFAVTGGDAGGQESLTIVATGNAALGDLRVGQPVLWDRSIVGRIELTGIGAARVVLVTNTGFHAAVDFGRFVPSNPNVKGSRPAFQKLPAEPATVSGDGRGRLHVNQFSMDKVTKEYKLAVGDWVCLNDPGAWPAAVQGCPLGVIERIEPDRNKSLFAHIVIKPQVDLAHLHEVAVMTKK